MIGAYWGRFNPPHKGHMKVIKMLLKRADKLIIVISRSDVKNTKMDTFSGKEREKMMRAYLREENIHGVRVISIPEGNSYPESIKTLYELSPKFDKLFLSDEKRKYIKMIEPEKLIVFPRRDSFSSTKIRNAIAKNRKWEHMTGKSVARLIRGLGGIERIKKAYG